MKRKIFLITLMVALLVCLLVISTSAKTVISESNIDESGDIVADVIYQVKDYQFYFSVDITYDDVNGNNKEGKFYYITGTGLYNNKLELLGVYVPHDFDFSQIIYLFDKADYTGDGAYGYSEHLRGSNGGVNAMHWHSYKSFDEETATFSEPTVNVRSSITAISYSKYMNYFGHYFLPTAPSLTTVTYNGKEPVEGTVFISPNVTEVMSNTFGGDGNNSANSTTKTPKYKRIVFEASTSSMTIQQYSFCRGVVEEVVFLARSYSFRNDSIAYQWVQGTNTPCLKRIVVQSGATVATAKVDLNVGNYDIVFIGTESEYATQSSEGKFTSLSNATGNVAYETLCYVYGHIAPQNDKNCETDEVCAREGCKHILSKGIDHVYEISHIYTSFLTQGALTSTCTNDGCEHVITKQTEALISFVGISTSMDKNGICIGYDINQDAINEYKANGNTFEFGVVAYIPLENEKNVEPIGNDLAPIDYTISTPLSAEYNAVDFVIKGFGAHTDTPLAMCAYVYNGSEVDYLNISIADSVSASQDDYASTITLNSVIEYAKSLE